MQRIRTAVGVENLSDRGRIETLENTLVDTGSELTWIPEAILQSLDVAIEGRKRFVSATGARVERDVGYAIVHAGGSTAPDYVVFAKPGDMVLLGARSLEGLNLRVDPVRKQLIPAGPILAGAT